MVSELSKLIEVNVVASEANWAWPEALKLDVFSVIDKLVDMGILWEQLNRLFIKRYDSDIFK